MLAGVCRRRLLSSVTLHGEPEVLRPVRATPCYPAKARKYVFTGVGLCVCVFVCDHDN